MFLVPWHPYHLFTRTPPHPAFIADISRHALHAKRLTTTRARRAAAARFPPRCMSCECFHWRKKASGAFCGPDRSAFNLCGADPFYFLHPSLHPRLLRCLLRARVCVCFSHAFIRSAPRTASPPSNSPPPVSTSSSLMVAGISAFCGRWSRTVDPLFQCTPSLRRAPCTPTQHHKKNETHTHTFTC
jgi:hypothetical protein